MLRGSTGMAEGYIAGEWETDDLVAVGMVAGYNLPPARPDEAAFSFHPLAVPETRSADAPDHEKARQADCRPLRPRQRRLFFPLFLDKSMNYSAALYRQCGSGRNPGRSTAREDGPDRRPTGSLARDPPARDRHRLGKTFRFTWPAAQAATSPLQQSRRSRPLWLANESPQPDSRIESR